MSDFTTLSQPIDSDWIINARRLTGTAGVRPRQLPAEHVTWTIIISRSGNKQPIQALTTPNIPDREILLALIERNSSGCYQ